MTPLAASDRIPMLCTVADLGRVLQVSRRRVYQLLADQKFPFAEVQPRVTGGPRFRGVDVQLYLEGHFAQRGQ